MNRNNALIQILFPFVLLVLNGCGGATPISVPTATPEETSVTEEPTEFADCIWGAEAIAWVDQNRDGKFDPTEIPLEGVQFQVDDPLNHLTDVADPAISDGHGRAELNVWLPGCPDTGFEISAKPPAGYEIVTDKVIRDSQGKHSFAFGFALVEGYSSPTPYVAGLTCKTYPTPADDFAVDAHGTVWLLNGDGIEKYQPESDAWALSYRTHFVPGWENQIFVSPRDVIWASDGDKTIRIENGLLKVHSLANDPISESIPSLGTTPDGLIWFLDTTYSLLNGYDPQTKSWKPVFYFASPIDSVPDWVFTDGDAWRAAYVDTSRESPEPQPDGWDFFPRSSYTGTKSIDEPFDASSFRADMDAQGRIWVAASGGMGQFDSTSNTWRILTSAELYDHFNERTVADLAIAPDGSVWVAIEGDHPLLFRHMPENASNAGEWRKYDFRDGIPDQSDLGTIEFDPDGNLWLGFGYSHGMAKCNVIGS